MLIFGLEIEAYRWPWQSGYNWRGFVGRSPYDGQTPSYRFSNGYNYQLGVMVSRRNGVVFDLIFGSIRFRKAHRCAHCGKRMKGIERGTRYWKLVRVPGKGATGKGTTPESMMHESCAKELEPWNYV